jgi:putative tryptophan/tyrosine transport system substrate-binding protein
MERRGSRWSRRAFVVGAAGFGLLAGCGRWPGQAQPAPRTYRLGWLVSAGYAPSEGFRTALSDLGYLEGRDVVFEFRSAEGRDERLPELATELVALPVDLLLVAGDPATQAAQQATRTLPIVMSPVGNPVETGLVASLAHPGGNVTGVTNYSPRLTGKQLQLLQEVAPTLSRVAILWRSGNTGTELGWREAQEAARELRLQLISLELHGPEAFDAAFETAVRDHAEAIMTLRDALVAAHSRQIVEFAAQQRLLGMYSHRTFIEAGGLMYYGANAAEMYRRAAAIVDKILKGAKPADLPIEQPMTFDFLVNLKTAQTLGITIPNEIMLQVTEVIQ